MIIDMSPEFVTIAMFIVVIAGLFFGHPVALVLGGTAALFAFFGWGPSGWYLFLGRAFDSTTNNILLAIPLFVLMAAFLSQSEISVGLFESMMYLFGPRERRHRPCRHRDVRHRSGLYRHHRGERRQHDADGCSGHAGSRLR